MYSMSIELCHLACTADQEFQFKTLLLAELTKNPQGAMFYLSHAPAGGAKCLTWCMNSYITRATSYRSALMYFDCMSYSAIPNYEVSKYVCVLALFDWSHQHT